MRRPRTVDSATRAGDTRRIGIGSLRYVGPRMNSDDERSFQVDATQDWRYPGATPPRDPAVPVLPLETAHPPLNPLGQYQLLGVLGKGGMGVVYQAVHLRLQKEVAVKVVSTRRLQDPESVARFEREMQAVGRLEHP